MEATLSTSSPLLTEPPLTRRTCLSNVLVAPKVVTSISTINRSCTRLAFPRTAPAEISTGIALIVACRTLGREGETVTAEEERCLSFVHSFNRHLSRVYYSLPGTVQETRGTVGEQEGKVSASMQDWCCPAWGVSFVFLFHQVGIHTLRDRSRIHTEGAQRFSQVCYCELQRPNVP